MKKLKIFFNWWFSELYIFPWCSYIIFASLAFEYIDKPISNLIFNITILITIIGFLLKIIKNNKKYKNS